MPPSRLHPQKVKTGLTMCWCLP
eukprot:COSAG01_NODE_4795_length_4739_cov_16.309267_6_plen_22_part_01